MRKILILASALAAGAVSGAAHAGCAPAFVDRSETVNLAGLTIGTGEVKREEFLVRVRNRDAGGGGSCTGTIRISQLNGTSDPYMPAFTLRSGGNQIDILPFQGTASSTMSDVLVPNAPAGPNGRAVPFQVTLPTPWGLKAGNYSQLLQFALFDESGNQTDTINVAIVIDVPRETNLRIVGATGGDEVSRIDLGTLTTTGTNVSDPFGVRIWSTSGYAVSFRSQNNGNLVRDGGTDRIPYTMTMDGGVVDLSSGVQRYLYNDFTTALGRLHPLVVRAGPIGAVRAGSYADRVIVTVTAV